MLFYNFAAPHTNNSVVTRNVQGLPLVPATILTSKCVKKTTIAIDCENVKIASYLRARDLGQRAAGVSCLGLAVYQRSQPPPK